MKVGSKSWRARRALIRLSRDRWISPEQLLKEYHEIYLKK